MKDELSKAEINKDSVQHAVVAAADAVSEVATILTSAVRDVAGALGGFATEVFEIREAARRAAVDRSESDIGDAVAPAPGPDEAPELDTNP